MTTGNQPISHGSISTRIPDDHGSFSGLSPTHGRDRKLKQWQYRCILLRCNSNQTQVPSPAQSRVFKLPKTLILNSYSSQYRIANSSSSFTPEPNCCNMSFAAYKMMHLATGIEHCASGFITHSAADFTPRVLPVTADDMDSDCTTSTKPIGPVPNLVTAAANILEVYTVRVQEDSSSSMDSKAAAEPKRGGVLAGVSGASLELVCHYRLLLYT